MGLLASGPKDILKFLVQPIMLTIKNGPLKGKKWIAASGIKFIRGTYEQYKTDAYLRHLHAGDVVYDVGAHVGYYTALAATMVGQRGQVIAFEPRPVNFSYLKRHIRTNGLPNVKLIEASVGDKAGAVRFHNKTGTGTGRVASDGRISVRMVCLDELFARGEIPPPNFIKIDVEGGEVEVLKGAGTVVARARPVILVATHGSREHAFVEQFLDSHNYTYTVLDQGGAKGDIEILAVPGKGKTAASARAVS
jgi:FkbM family methyltransferase